MKLPNRLYKTYKFPAKFNIHALAETLPPSTNLPIPNPVGSSFSPSTSTSKWKKTSRSGGLYSSQENTFNMNPRKIKKYLDEYVIGQEELKVTLSVALYNHYQRIEINKSQDVIRLDKSNILLFGPSGSGKTLTAKTIANLLNVPFTMNDATSFTQAGYVGDDVESCISRLLISCDYNVEQAERGIVFIDEIDKIARKSDQSNSNQRDVSGEGVQQGLLRMLEGTTIHVSVKPGTIVGSRLAQPGESFSVDTSNILFICSGAFIGLEKIISRRLNKTGGIGFGSALNGGLENEQSQEQTLRNLDFVEPEDVIQYGFIPEFIGRMPVFVSSKPLSKDQLAEILIKPRNALAKQYKSLFKKSRVRNLTIFQFIYF